MHPSLILRAAVASDALLQSQAALGLWRHVVVMCCSCLTISWQELRRLGNHDERPENCFWKGRRADQLPLCIQLFLRLWAGNFEGLLSKVEVSKCV